MQSRAGTRQWWSSGQPWVWLQAGAVTISVVLVAGLLLLIAWRGLGHFWPSTLHEWVVRGDDGQQRVLVGQLRDSESVLAQRLRESGQDISDGLDEVRRYLLKVGNRDLVGQDFTWVLETSILERGMPLNLMVMERQEWGVFMGHLVGIREAGSLVPVSDVWAEFSARLARANEMREEIRRLEKDEIGVINRQLEKLRLQERSMSRRGNPDPADLDKLAGERAELEARYLGLEAELLAAYEDIRRDAAVVMTGDGQELDVLFSSVLDAWRPNAMTMREKVGHYVAKLWQFLSGDPREANTEGGVFPAIFGTVLMVMLMTLLVTPVGVIAAIYLREYAPQGALTRFIRITVNNLAGVPSIVYGVFGLGFFIYFVGGGLDRMFFSDALPSPTFGTGGLFWASLTLALLTLPVVIVSTEEGLARIPSAIRDGSLALGATQWETLVRIVIPIASPGIITGVILAVARAAGEVAPLMLVGVVKLAPSLPIDGQFPFLHLERKFMHLGFHIYDVGFQSPNVEAARPLVYATALLLVVITILLNLVAIRARNRLREKFREVEAL